MSSSIDERSREVVAEFSMLDDWTDRYAHLIEQAAQLPLFDEADRKDEFKVRGCQSQVWLRADADAGRLHLRADSDAIITKGLVALLVRVLDDQPAAAVRDAELSFLEEIGLREHLSPGRANGLSAMVQRIKEFAAEAAGVA